MQLDVMSSSSDEMKVTEPEVTNSTVDKRKSSKPVMEKRRRARINNSLNQLKVILLEALKKDSTRHSKLEKADILEMTVNYLKNVERQRLSMSLSIDPSVIDKYKAGFNECRNEVMRFLSTCEGVTVDVRTRLLSHLASCIRCIHSLQNHANVFDENGFELLPQQASFVIHRNCSGFHVEDLPQGPNALPLHSTATAADPDSALTDQAIQPPHIFNVKSSSRNDSSLISSSFVDNSTFLPCTTPPLSSPVASIRSGVSEISSLSAPTASPKSKLTTQVLSDRAIQTPAFSPQSQIGHPAKVFPSFVHHSTNLMKSHIPDGFQHLKQNESSGVSNIEGQSLSGSSKSSELEKEEHSESRSPHFQKCNSTEHPSKDDSDCDLKQKERRFKRENLKRNHCVQNKLAYDDVERKRTLKAAVLPHLNLLGQNRRALTTNCRENVQTYFCPNAVLPERNRQSEAFNEGTNVAQADKTERPLNVQSLLISSYDINNNTSRNSLTHSKSSHKNKARNHNPWRPWSDNGSVENNL